MSDQAIFDTLTQALRDLLADQSIVLTADTKRSDVPNWDSFAYVNFIVIVEMQYGIKFSVSEVESFENVGAIVNRIKEMTGA
jgi:acyl carrier protein